VALTTKVRKKMGKNVCEHTPAFKLNEDIFGKGQPFA
jgi:hypothetical protein